MAGPAPAPAELRPPGREDHGSRNARPLGESGGAGGGIGRGEVGGGAEK